MNVDKDRGYKTTPTRPGAPLPEELEKLVRPQMQSLSEELDRAEIELMYAIAQHRKAWASTRALLKHLQTTGVYVDSDPTYAKTSGGIGFWREEMTAQATTILALRELIYDRS